ncbi:MAG: hypothetical protein WCW13_02045, partial [archaeon]
MQFKLNFLVILLVIFFSVFCFAIPTLSISMVAPTQANADAGVVQNFTKDQFTNVSAIVNCSGANCGNVEVGLAYNKSISWLNSIVNTPAFRPGNSNDMTVNDSFIDSVGNYY